MENRLLLALFLVFGVTTCSQSSSPGPEFRRPQCELGVGDVGKWELLAFPSGVLAGIGAGADNEFILLGGENCGFCAINTLSAPGSAWETEAISERIWASAAGDLVATPELIATSEIIQHQASPVEYPPNGLAILDRESLIWNILEPPEEYGRRFGATLHWTGTRLLLWGGNQAENGDPSLLPTTPTLLSLDGYFVEPTTGEWEQMPAPWPDRGYEYRDTDAIANLARLWTPEGFFIVGVAPDSKSGVSAIYSLERGVWRYPEATPPPERIFARLSYHEGYVYLFGGAKPGTEVASDGRPLGDFGGYYSDFWRYSFTEDLWEEIDVPEFADLQAAYGAWIGDKLIFSGFQCSVATIYDAVSGDWTTSSLENGPPDGGYVTSLGAQVVVHGVQDQLGQIPAIWTLTFP